MKFCFNELLLALSYAFDCVEFELIGSTTEHSKRVACMCAIMGKSMGLNNHELSDLTACALLHDNALTEYIQSEYQMGKDDDERPKFSHKDHCILGEENICDFPFYGDTKDVILYHHENEDGTGTFGKKGPEVPLYAKMIHLTDLVDCVFQPGTEMTQEQYEKMVGFVRKNIGNIFGENEAELFIANADFEFMQSIRMGNSAKILQQLFPQSIGEYSPRQIMDISTIFAKLIDYKSTFTTNHSLGIAQKAYKMGEFYGYQEEEKAKLYLAGALHDIGKLAIHADILEKPGKLTADEFKTMKHHAAISFEILSSVQGFEDIARWGALHHEKLDGSGYPFGYTADQLVHHERLMAVLDIYQALREERPYKRGMEHNEVIERLTSMAQKELLDKNIVRDIDYVFGK